MNDEEKRANMRTKNRNSIQSTNDRMHHVKIKTDGETH